MGQPQSTQLRDPCMRSCQADADAFVTCIRYSPANTRVRPSFGAEAMFGTLPAEMVERASGRTDPARLRRFKLSVVTIWFPSLMRRDCLEACVIYQISER
jgi:hypothetical protein